MIKSAKLLITALMAIALFSFSHAALAADSWGLPGEEEVRFDAKVIDVLCVLSGDCPPDRGAGKRLLGLLKEDGELVLAIKNGGPFTGAVADLLPHCGEMVTADGLFTINYGVKTFAVQFLRRRRGNGGAPTVSSNNGRRCVGSRPRTRRRGAGSATTKQFWRSSASRVNWA